MMRKRSLLVVLAAGLWLTAAGYAGVPSPDDMPQRPHRVADDLNPSAPRREADVQTVDHNVLAEEPLGSTRLVSDIRNPDRVPGRIPMNTRARGPDAGP